jgi:quercetin dioxygenase-like cupin family protein
MRHWHLPSLVGSSEKRSERAPGAGAPRVPSVGRQMPRVLFSSPECRVVVLDLRSGQDLADHHVRERAVVEVISGRVSIKTADGTVECETGTLVTFDPGERHALRGLDDARILLVLAPWPAAGHNAASEAPHDQHLPANATVGPVESLDTAAADVAPADPSRWRRVVPEQQEMKAVRQQRRILLVVDQTMSDARVVHPSVRAVVDRHPEEVYVLAPILTTRLAWATNDDADAIADAEQRLAETLQQLYERDIDAAGTVGGDDDLLTAIGDALAEFPADEIIIAIHADHDRHWRERNLAAKIRGHYPQRLTELLVEADGAASIRT